MTKEEFVAASINVANFYYGVKLPLTTENLMEKDDCNYYFYYELPSSYDDDDDNEVECVYWFSVSNFKDHPEDSIEIARGIDGRRGDHFLLSYKDWLEKREAPQISSIIV